MKPTETYNPECPPKVSQFSILDDDIELEVIALLALYGPVKILVTRGKSWNKG